MKIAIVEWWPRLCGSVNWGHHFYAGGKKSRLAYVDLVTFSNSGRPLAAWNLGNSDWKIHRLSDAVDVLDSYDFVVFVDLVCFAPQLTTKDGSAAPYTNIVLRMKTPWTAMYHGGIYPAKHDETIATMLSANSFSGRLITTRLDQAIERLTPFGMNKDKFYHNPYLPFEPSLLNLGDLNYTVGKPKIAMTARINPNKGQFAMMELLQSLKTSIECYGYVAYGMPSCAWSLYELAIQLGYKVIKEPVPKGGKITDNPNVPKFHTGPYAVQCGVKRFNYHGEFTKYPNIAGHIHVSLTNESFGDTPEYVTLEAIAAGAAATVSAHHVSSKALKYKKPGIIALPYSNGSPRIKKEGGVNISKMKWDRAAMVKELNHLATEVDLKKLNEQQQANILGKHDARNYFNAVMNAVS